MVSLQKIADEWSFLSEAALENFVWEHLSDLLGLTPLARQQVCQGEVCDILAVDNSRQLHILELKNGEDRYIIQQLTRYYANLTEVMPFADRIDYARPVRLLAIAPSYHRHNLIDQQYSTLQFELWQFQLKEQDQQVWFRIATLDGRANHQLLIPSQSSNTQLDTDAPVPPELLLSWLSGCTEAEQRGILRLRAKLLAGSDRIKEAIDGNWIRYGSGKTRLCCEIYFERKRQRPVLFLWLPTPGSQVLAHRKPVTGRLRLWLDGVTVSHVGHVIEGLGKMRTQAEWSQIPKEKRPKTFFSSFTSRSQVPVEIMDYLGCRDQPLQPDYWDVLADMALVAWHKRA